MSLTICFTLQTWHFAMPCLRLKDLISFAGMIYRMYMFKGYGRLQPFRFYVLDPCLYNPLIYKALPILHLGFILNTMALVSLANMTFLVCFMSFMALLKFIMALNTVSFCYTGHE